MYIYKGLCNLYLSAKRANSSFLIYNSINSVILKAINQIPLSVFNTGASNGRLTVRYLRSPEISDPLLFEITKFC